MNKSNYGFPMKKEERIDYNKGPKTTLKDWQKVVVALPLVAVTAYFWNTPGALGRNLIWLIPLTFGVYAAFKYSNK